MHSEIKTTSPKIEHFQILERKQKTREISNIRQNDDVSQPTLAADQTHRANQNRQQLNQANPKIQNQANPQSIHYRISKIEKEKQQIERKYSPFQRN